MSAFFGSLMAATPIIFGSLLIVAGFIVIVRAVTQLAIRPALAR